MLNPPRHLALRPLPNEPAGEALETFCLRLGEHLRGFAQPVSLSHSLIADAFQQYFGIYPPVVTQLGSLLETCDVDWTNSVPIYTSEPSFLVFDNNIGQWQIQVREDAGIMESIHILHELYELIWWRCYHLMPEWRDWAAFSEMKHPHHTAERFAYNIVLKMNTFPYVAKEHGYNPYTLAGKFQTAPGVCFQAFNYLQFSAPYLQFRLDFTAKPNQGTFQFEESPAVIAKLYAKNSKNLKSNGRLNPHNWGGMFSLYNALPANGSIVDVEDWLCQAVLRGYVIGRETNSLLHIPLSGSVFVVVRSRAYRAFVQVVSMRSKDLLIDSPLQDHLQSGMMGSHVES